MNAITRRTMIAGMLALPTLLAACAQSQEATADDQGEAQMLGGWQVAAPGEPLVDDAARELLASALTEADGAYEPYAEIAQQVVSGTNHAFLVTGEGGAWCVAVVYENLDGEASLVSVAEIDPNEIATADEDASEGLLGAWQVLEQAGAALSPAEAQEAFDLAYGAYVGVDLHPIACLATQVVSGTNYRVLCEGAPVVPDATHHLYVATAYADLDGNAEFSEVELVDLLAYVGA